MAFSGRDLKVTFRDQYGTEGLGGPLTAFVGLQSVSRAGARAEVDITTAEDDGWRTLLVKPGSRSVDLSFSGIMKTPSYDRLLVIQRRENTDQPMLFTIEHPTGYREGGTGFISSLETTGEHSGAVAFSCSVMLHGPLLRSIGKGYIASGVKFGDFEVFNGAAYLQSREDVNNTDSDLGNIQGMDAKDGTIYAFSNRYYVSIDPETGQGTKISTTRDLGLTGVTQFRTLAIDPNHATLAYAITNHDYLISFNHKTGGGATRVGTATNWGVGDEDNMAALFFWNGQLYAWGHEHDRLYTVAKTTGVATAVADSHENLYETARGEGGFGSTNPTGWASDGVQIIVVNSTRHAFRVNLADQYAELIQPNAYWGAFGDGFTSNSPYVAILT